MANKRQKKKNETKRNKYTFLNYHRATLVVRHAELKRYSSHSMFQSECPKCKYGVLMVTRDSDTLELLDLDRCLLCGQRFRYTDMERFRQPWRRVER